LRVPTIISYDRYLIQLRASQGTMTMTMRWLLISGQRIMVETQLHCGLVKDNVDVGGLGKQFIEKHVCIFSPSVFVD
jgi:hypothetical protein